LWWSFFYQIGGIWQARITKKPLFFSSCLWLSLCFSFKHAGERAAAGLAATPLQA